METSVRMINTLTLHRHTTTASLLSPNLKSRFYPRSTPHTIPPTLLRTRSLSPALSATNSGAAAFPSPNFSRQLGFFLSLSTASNPQPPPSNNLPTSQPSDGKFFTWHKPPSSGGADGAPVGGKPKTAAVVLGWLGATQKHLRRYAELYTSRGIEAVTFVVPVKDAMSWDLGKTVEDRIEKLAEEVVSWLSNDGGRGRSLIFHTFSTTGWLVYGSVLAHMEGQPDLIEKIKGCIFDSGGDPELNPKAFAFICGLDDIDLHQGACDTIVRMLVILDKVWAAGFGAALLKKRNTRISPSAEAKSDTGNDIDKSKLQEEDPNILEAAVLLALESMFTIVFKLPEVNQKLSKIIYRLSENQPQCPQLYLYSTADKVIRYRTLESFIEQQKMRGKDVRSFNFGSSPHVDHYRSFPAAYSSQVNNFLCETLVVGKPR